MNSESELSWADSSVRYMFVHGALWICHVVNKLVKNCLLNITHCSWKTNGHRQLCYSLSDVFCWKALRSIMGKMSSVIASLFFLLEFSCVLSACWQRPLSHCPLLHLTQGVLHSCPLRPRMAWFLDFTFSLSVFKAAVINRTFAKFLCSYKDSFNLLSFFCISYDYAFTTKMHLF